MPKKLAQTPAPVKTNGSNTHRAEAVAVELLGAEYYETELRVHVPRRRPPPSTPEPPPPDDDATPSPAELMSPVTWSPRDVLVPYVLLAVSIEHAHGYLIEEYLRGLGLFGLEMSTLYRTLRQLERDGLLSSTWEPGPSGPARRVYALTDAGSAWLDTRARALDGFRSLLDRFFGLYTPPTAKA